MSEVLLIAGASPIVEDVRRYAAAAGVSVHLCPDVVEAMQAWATASLVLIDPHLLSAVASLSPVRRDRVFVVAHEECSTATLEVALQVGASSVLRLDREPHALSVELTNAEAPSAVSAVTAGVMAGCGGAGASVFATALALSAAEHATTLLIETDPWATSAQEWLGVPIQPGFGWEALSGSLGRVSPTSLRSSVARSARLGVLTWTGQERAALSPRVATDVVRAARSGHQVVVLDLQRQALELNRALLLSADRLIVLSHPSPRCVSTAGRVVAGYGRANTTLVVRGGRDWRPRELREASGVSDVVMMDEQRRLDEHLALGAGPLASSRGPLAKTCMQVWAELLR